MVDDYWIGWLAGMIDGEGSISISRVKRKNYRRGYRFAPRLTISNSHKETIMFVWDLVKKITGSNQGYVGKTFSPTRGKKIIHCIAFHSNATKRILEKVKLKTKKKQKKLILEALNILEKNKHVCHRTHNIPPENDKRLDEICDELHKLNKWSHTEYRNKKMSRERTQQ